MPKAPINENDGPMLRKHYIRFSGKILNMKSEAISETMEQASHCNLNTGIRPLYVGHDLTALRSIKTISHDVDSVFAGGLFGSNGGSATLEKGEYGFGHAGRQKGRDSIPDLSSYLDLATTKFKLIRKALKPCRLPMGYSSVLRRMEITTLLGFEEFCPNSASGPIPPEAPK